MPAPPVRSVDIPGVTGATVTMGCAWVRTDRRSERVVVSVGGELDVSGSPALAGAMQAYVQSSAPTALTIDLSELEFIDASGIRALLRIEEDAAAHGGEARLTNPSPPVSRLFEICGLSQHLEPGSRSDLTSCNSGTSNRSGDE